MRQPDGSTPGRCAVKASAAQPVRPPDMAFTSGRPVTLRAVSRSIDSSGSLVDSLIQTGRQTLKKASVDDIAGLAAELAYRVLLALFPFCIFLAALGAFASHAAGIENPTDRIMSSVEDTLPADAASVLRGQLEGVLEHRNTGLLTVGAIASLWSASSATSTILKALARLYGAQERRPFWKRTLVSLALTMAAGAFFASAFTILILGQIFASDIGDLLGVRGAAVTVMTWLRVPAVIILLAVATAVLYRAAPGGAGVPWVSPGALLFIPAWIISTLAFGIYVSNFGAYNATYGTLGGVIVLMVWLYVSSLLMLAGAEVNAVLSAQHRQPEQPQASA